MSLEEKKQRRGSKAPVLLTSLVDKLPPSHEWLINRATFPILVASIFILKHAFPDGRCSLKTKRAEEKWPPDTSWSYICCRLVASLVVKSSPFASKCQIEQSFNTQQTNTQSDSFNWDACHQTTVAIIPQKQKLKSTPQVCKIFFLLFKVSTFWQLQKANIRFYHPSGFLSWTTLIYIYYVFHLLLWH